MRGPGNSGVLPVMPRARPFWPVKSQRGREHAARPTSTCRLIWPARLLHNLNEIDSALRARVPPGTKSDSRAAGHRTDHSSFCGEATGKCSSRSPEGRRSAVTTASKARARDTAVVAKSEPGLRVLLVEDAPFLRHAFGRLLRLHGFEVYEATDGLEALHCVSVFRPQVVLTDLMMPVMDGIELIRRLHENPKTSNLPVVAITADATENSLRSAREAGAAEVLTKPIHLPELLERLRHLRRANGMS